MTSQDKLARLAGLLYLLSLPTIGVWYATWSPLPAGDTDAVLERLAASRGLLELAILLGAAGFVGHLVLGLILYRLFSPVGKGAASLLVSVIVAGLPLSLAAVARQMDVLSLADGAQDMLPAGGEQLQTQVMLALHSYNSLFLVGTIFWGLWLIPLGWLVYRSSFMPRVLGVLLIVGSLFYLSAFAGTVLDENYQHTVIGRMVGIFSGVPGVLGEVGTALWLLIIGARARRA